METFEFSDAFLETAKKITLADLLDAPFTQPWTFSMIANSCNCSFHFEQNHEREELLEMRLNKIMKSVPYEERQAMFSQCAAMVKQRQEQANKRDAA